MLIEDKTTKTGGNITFINFTYDEETAFAEWLFDVLASRWLHEDYHKGFRKLLIYLFRKKSSGRDITEKEFSELIEHIEHIEQSNYFGDLIPPWPPVIKNNGKCLRIRANRFGKLSPEEQINALKSRRRQAWQEVWETHVVRKRVPECRFFDNNDKQEAQHELETEFWERVDEVMNEFGCTEQDAIKEAEDYMPRLQK
mgnify:CR=1 FL=1